MSLETQVERKLSGRMAAASKAFLWLAAAGIVGMLVGLAYAQRWFTPTIDLYFFTHTAAGMNRGMAVKLVGFNVGLLEQVSVVGELRVKGKLVMDRRYRDVVGKDARIRLSKEGLLGTTVLELIPGSGDPGPVENGDVLALEREMDYTTMVLYLVERVGPAIDDVRQIAARLADPEAGLPKTLRDLGEVAAAVTAMANSVGRLAVDGSRLTREVPVRIDPVLSDVRRSVAQIEALVKQLNQEVPPTMDEARKSLQGVQAATESLRRVIADDVPRVLRRGEAVLDDADEMVGGVRRAWPVRNMLPPAEEKLIELDSSDGAAHATKRKPAP